MKVFADHGVEGHFASTRIIIRPYAWQQSRLFGLPVVRFLPALGLGFRCWWTGLRSRERGPFVTVGAAHGLVLAFLQWLFQPLVPRRTHVLFDLLLERRRSGLAALFDHMRTALFRHAIDGAVVWGRADIELYALEHDIPAEKLRFQPFHITLENYEFEIRDDGYIFAGGNHGRDYETVIRALADVDYPVLIATQAPGIEDLAREHDHITVKSVSPDEFRRVMAASTLVVEAHPRSFFRTAGHQTFLNAMWMGKPFVMADRKSADGYFEDGRDWFVVDHEDASGLRERVVQLLDNRELAVAMSERARYRVRQPRFRTLNCMQQIYNHALELEAARRGDGVRPLVIDEY